MKSKKRSLLSLLLSTAFLLIAVAIPVISYATESADLVVYDADVDIKAQRETMAAPTKENYVFAGWYKVDSEAETGYTALNKAEADAADSAVAKFVHKDVLGVRCQILADTDASSDSTALRMMTSVDSFKYSSVGFKIELQGKTAIVDSDTVYEIVKGYTKDGVNEYTAKEAFGCDISQYFMSFKITEISYELFEETFAITPFWVTQDGTTVEGTAKKTFKIIDHMENKLFSLPKTADTLLNTPITLTLESETEIPAAEVTWISSDNNVATVANGVVTPLTKGEATISAKYKGRTASCDVTVYNKYITTGAEWETIYDDLSGYYKVVADLDTVTRGSTATHTSVFTGLIDLGGHTVKIPGGRLFNTLNGATIRNGYLEGTGAYGVWGGAIAHVATDVTLENITADVTLLVAYANNNNTEWYQSNIGGLCNTINSGTVTSCEVHVTLPSDFMPSNSFSITDISAIGRAGNGVLTMTDCSATIVNNYNDETIHLLLGCENNEPAKERYLSMAETAGTKLGTPLTLEVESNIEMSMSEVTWESSNTDVATVANGVVTPLTKGEVTITAQYKGATASCDVTVYTAYISTGTEWATVYDDLTGYYKVVADMENLSIPDTRKSETVFTGLIDFGGHTVNTPDKRLFYALKNATIRNGHLKGTSTYGIWGGILADEAINVTIENIIADVAYNQTYTCRNNSDWMKRNPGGLCNLITGGTITSCVVNVTITSDIAITSGYSISDISAIGRTSDSASLTMTDCSATLVNEKNEDTIHLLAGASNDKTVEQFTMSMSETADTILNTPLTLEVESDIEIPVSEITWESSNTDVATVANGVVTPLTKGEVTITAQYKGATASSDVTVYNKYITTGEEWLTIYDDLSGYYKVIADLENLSIPDTRPSTTVFTGLIDFGGHTVKTPDRRLFYALSSATIRNGHLDGTAAYGIWGGILSDEAINVTIENITADVAYNQTYVCRNNSDWMKRNPGGLCNLITGGTITSCVVNVTITSDIAITSGYSISNISAIGRTNDRASLTMTDCSATLVNNYNDDTIHLLAGASNDETVTDTATTN